MKISFENISFYNTRDFFTFEVKNFLPLELYDELNYYFPNFHQLKMKNKVMNYNGDNKYSINKSLKVYEEIIEKSKLFNFFFTNISKKEFAVELLNIIFFKVLKSRLHNVWDALTLFKPLCFVNEHKEYSLLKRIFFKQISVNHQISFITNGGKLLPHTDSRSKICSLMLYFPDKRLNTTERAKEINIGTQFWKSEINNYENCTFKKFENSFYLKSQIDLKTKFDGPVLYGFIKNHKSWHSVDYFDINPEYVRRSINININYKV
jgi:hypothetical protein